MQIKDIIFAIIMLKKRSRSIQKDQQMGQITSEGGYETYIQSSDVIGQRQKTNSFFNVPALFVGLTPKAVSDCDSVRSPTSPLDFKLFCNLGNCFRFPSKIPQEGNQQKCWVCHKVGLGSIVDDSVDDDDDRNLTEKDNNNNNNKVIIPSSNSKTILFGSQIRSKGVPISPECANFCQAPNSLPKNCAIFPHARLRPSSDVVQKGSSDVLFEIGGDPLEFDPFEKVQSFSLDSKRIGSEIYKLGTRSESRSKRSCFESEIVEKSLGFDLIGGDCNAENKLSAGGLMSIASGNEMARSLTPEEIELSEDYTCVISHGPNPKTTHIFGDCVLECHPTGIDVGNKRESLDEIVAAPSVYPSNDFLSYCHFCKKKLEEGKDIYMYRGEKAFCSWDCRLEEISIEEEQERSVTEAPGEPCRSENGDNIFEKSIFVAI